MHITGNIYWYPWQGYGNNCNSYLVAGEELILIDPGHVQNEFRENCLEYLTRNLKLDGFNLEQVKLILLTHGHPDHSESAGIIREQSGARLAVHEEDYTFLRVLEQRYRGMGRPGPAMEPDFYLQEGELQVDLGKKSIQLQVIHTPGHSPGSVSFYLPAEKALITGDCVFHSSIGRADLPGGNMQVLGRSIERLAALEEVELLLPGHMNIVSGREPVARNFTLIRNLFFR